MAYMVRTDEMDTTVFEDYEGELLDLLVATVEEEQELPEFINFIDTNTEDERSVATDTILSQAQIDVLNDAMITTDGWDYHHIKWILNLVKERCNDI